MRQFTEISFLRSGFLRSSSFIFVTLEYLALIFDFFAPAHVLETLLFVLFTGATAVQILVWGILFSQMARQRKKHTFPADDHALPNVTVIICARNEATNLQKNLPKIMEQQYAASFEIIVVDDASTDDTSQVLLALKETCTALHILQIAQKNNPGKKHALEQGVLAARYDWLLLTDADCAPTSIFWIKEMMQCSAMPGTEIIAGYAPIQVARRGQHYLSLFPQYEVAYTALQYGAFALAGIPYMGVGRNLAWNKSLFIKKNGFSTHQHLASGDDDLFVNGVATRHNTQLCLSPETFMVSPAPTTWQTWLRQKRRHLSAGTLYRPVHRVLLGGTALTHTLHYGLGAILMILGHFFMPVVVVYLLRMAVVWPLCLRIFTKLHENRLIPLLPLWDGLLAVWYGAFVPFLMWGKKQIKWR